MIKSEIFNGSNFESEKVKSILEGAYHNRMQRLRLFHGKDGKVWNEEYDVCGYIGRSTGIQKIALLINNKSSSGGNGIMTDRIVGIYDTKMKKCLFWADGYKMPKVIIALCGSNDLIKKGYTHEVWLDNQLYANCKNLKEAQKLADFMTAKRFSK